jgi:hypothetical protein
VRGRLVRLPESTAHGLLLLRGYPPPRISHHTLPLTPRFQFRPVRVWATLLPLDLGGELRVVFRASAVQARTPVDLDRLNPAARIIGQTFQMAAAIPGS